MAIPPDQARLLGTGALLHDIGLSEIPDRVLRKRPDQTTKPERDLRALHVEYGVNLGKKLGLPTEVLAIIAQHHELAMAAVTRWAPNLTRLHRWRASSRW